MKQTFKQFLIETPVGDYKLVGNWDKGSSFTRKRDRTILQHPRAIEILKKKFNNNHHTFNLYFLNSKEGRLHSELGAKDIEWVRENLGNEVADAVEPSYKEEQNVSIVFTNNKGDENRPMTAWMVAHRMAHSLARTDYGGRNQFQSYKESMNTIFWSLSTILEEYGIKEFPHTEDRATKMTSDRFDANKKRTNQLIMKHFFTQVCTFRSARDNMIRDWFEVTNELFAQFITTGKIKFKSPPAKFGTKGAFGSGTGEFYLRGSKEDVVDSLHSLANTLEYYFDELLSDVSGRILIM